MEAEKRFITRDCYGQALQFTGSGKSIQVFDQDADIFYSEKEAIDALTKANEKDGYIEEL